LGERRGAYRDLVSKPEGRRPLPHGRIILKWIFKRLDGEETWTGLIWFRIGTGGVLLWMR
jgi:hypothetical protein